MSEQAWGQQITAHVYRAGTFTEDELTRLTDAINEAIPDAGFMGLFLNVVQDEPRDQVGT